MGLFGSGAPAGLGGFHLVCLRPPGSGELAVRHEEPVLPALHGASSLRPAAAGGPDQVGGLQGQRGHRLLHPLQQEGRRGSIHPFTGGPGRTPQVQGAAGLGLRTVRVDPCNQPMAAAPVPTCAAAGRGFMEPPSGDTVTELFMHSPLNSSGPESCSFTVGDSDRSHSTGEVAEVHTPHTEAAVQVQTYLDESDSAVSSGEGEAV